METQFGRNGMEWNCIAHAICLQHTAPVPAKVTMVIADYRHAAASKRWPFLFIHGIVSAQEDGTYRSAEKLVRKLVMTIHRAIY